MSSNSSVKCSQITPQCVQRDGPLEAAAQVPDADRGQEGVGAGGLVRRLPPRPRPRPQRLSPHRPQTRPPPLRPQVRSNRRGGPGRGRDLGHSHWRHSRGLMTRLIEPYASLPFIGILLQGDRSPHKLLFVDIFLNYSAGWWAVTVAAMLPSWVTELPTLTATKFWSMR